MKKVVRRPKPAGSWEDPLKEKQWRKAMKIKESLGLNDAQRHELAQMIPGVDKDDGGSWKDLSADQLNYLITMMEGFAYISYMKHMEGWQWLPPEQ